MKKFLVMILFIVSTMIVVAEEGYNTGWFNDRILPDKNYSTFSEVSSIIKKNKGDNYIRKNNVCDYYGYEDYNTHIVLEMYCYDPNEGEDIFQYFVKIYGRDKISSIKNKINAGQKVFTFPSILDLRTEDSTGIYFGE